MKSKRILQLLAKKMGQAASDKEMAELQKLLQQNPEYSFLIEMLQSFEIEKLHKEPALKEDDLMQESWLMLERELDEVPSPGKPQEIKNAQLTKTLPSWTRIAAIWAGILLLAGFYFFNNNSPKEDSLKKVTGMVNQVSVPFGTPEKKVLPDEL